MTTTETATTETPIIWRKGKRVILRPFEERDIPYFRRWINNPDNNKYLARTAPLSDHTQRQWYESAQGSDPDRIRVAICTHDGTLIGNTELRINRTKQSATTGTLIGNPEFQGKGYGTDAKMLILSYAFFWLGLRKVTSRILSFNDRSKRYAEKCGYRHMATIEKEHFRNGQWIDEDLYVIFQDDWYPVWQAYCEDWDDAPEHT